MARQSTEEEKIKDAKEAWHLYSIDKAGYVNPCLASRETLSDFKAALKEEINVEIMKWQHDAGYCGGLQKALDIIDQVHPNS